MTQDELSLTPTQARTFEALTRAAAQSPFTVLRAASGTGKTTLMRALRDTLGGRLLTAADGLTAIARADPAGMEEAFIGMLEAALADAELVLLDDEDLFEALGTGFADRPGYLLSLLGSLVERLDAGRRLVVSATSNQSELHKSGNLVEIAGLDADDYRHLFDRLLVAPLPAADVDRIFRAYRHLSCQQLSVTARLANEAGASTAPEVIDLLERFISRGNVDIEEVEAVTLEGLVGISDIVRELERTVIIPMTRPDLARSLGLKPKRGVLLHGEPGTGKTTIGRALAHSMKGKFLMIDGTFIPGETGFKGRVDAVIKAAELNSPAVIFIDDADVIFQHGEMAGFARKLLSKLDGVQSESQNNVCIVMTAMNLADMPPALLRSGRVEVWLEMRLPDAGQRWEIIESYAKDLAAELVLIDRAAVSAATQGFTPADLRGLVGDARGHLAYDRNKGRAARTLEDYFLIAAGDIRTRKQRLGFATPVAA